MPEFLCNVKNRDITFSRNINKHCEDEVAARNKPDLYSELLPAMSVKACRTAYDGKVPALKTLLTNPATRAAIEQLFEVPGLYGVSILRPLVVYCTISLLIVAFPFHYCVPARGACVDAGRGCVLHVSGSMCAYAYDTCAHMLVGVLSFL